MNWISTKIFGYLLIFSIWVLLSIVIITGSLEFFGISKNIVIDVQLTNSLEPHSLSLLKEVASNLKKYFSDFERVFIVSKVLSSNELKID